MIDAYGDGRVIFDTDSGFAFTTESVRGGRVHPTPSVQEAAALRSNEVAYWGLNNDWPQQVEEEIRDSDLLRPLIRKQARRMIGSGLRYGTLSFDEITGDERWMPLRVPAIDAALRRTNAKRFVFESWIEWLSHGNRFAELQTDHGGDVVGLFCQRCTRSRVQYTKDGSAPKVAYIGGKWATGGTVKDATKVPLLDPYYDAAKQIKDSSSARFLLHSWLQEGDQDHYGVAQWHGLIHGRYLELAKAIIKSKLYLTLNLSHMRYHVEVGEEYWSRAYPGFSEKPPEEKKKIKQEEVKAFTQWATGLEKSGRTLLTERLIDEVAQKKEYRSLWKVTPFKLDVPTGAYIEDSAEVDAKIIRAFMDASLFGATPSKDRNSAGSGSDKMIAHAQELADNEADADMIVEPFEIMAEVNGWAEKYAGGQQIHWWFDHPQLTHTRPKER